MNPITADFLNAIPDRAAGGIMTYLRRHIDGTTSLEEVLDEIPGAEAGVTRELVAFRFYLQDYIRAVSREVETLTGGATNHAELVDRLDRWRGGDAVTYVTFNYDTILDSALRGHYAWTGPGDAGLVRRSAGVLAPETAWLL